MAMLSRTLMADRLWQLAADLSIGKLKVGQTKAGQEHWHSHMVAPLEPAMGGTNLKQKLIKI